jgi:hypothetical protein
MNKKKTIRIFFMTDLSVAVPIAWRKIDVFVFVCDWHILDCWIFIYTHHACMIHHTSKSKGKSVQKWQKYASMLWTARINPNLRNPWYLWWNTIEDSSLKENKSSRCCHCKRVMKAVYVGIETETNAMYKSSWKVSIPSATVCTHL